MVCQARFALEHSPIPVWYSGGAWSVSSGGNDGPKSESSEGKVQLRISVSDASDKTPIELAHVVLRRGGKFISDEATNPAGQARFRDVEPGDYTLMVWFIGYATRIDTITVDQNTLPV